MRSRREVAPKFGDAVARIHVDGYEGCSREAIRELAYQEEDKHYVKLSFTHQIQLRRRERTLGLRVSRLIEALNPVLGLVELIHDLITGPVKDVLREVGDVMRFAANYDQTRARSLVGSRSTFGRGYEQYRE